MNGIEWQGSIVMPDFRAKERVLRQNIIAKDFHIDQLKKSITKLEEDAEAAAEREDTLRTEVKRLRVQFRNFKARVTTSKDGQHDA
jgi:FtsZ-binding cell division protein ZapB